MSTDTPFHVLIAGGGVAALEAMMAIRALAGDRARITVLAPERDFRYRPMTVAEPFALARSRHVALAAITAEFDAELVVGALASIAPQRRLAITRGEQRIPYDALVVACGTRIRPAFAGAITIDDRSLGETLRGLVRDVEQGYTSEIAFVAPAHAFWPLPLYELALLTARRAYDMNAEVDISVVSPERAPLAMFGDGICDELTRLLADAGIAFRGSSFAELAHGELVLRPGGMHLRPGRVVALPLLEGPQIAGLPTDPHGFIAVTPLGEVRGLDGVYAAGDATAYPIKHGSIAAQQADAAASAIVALFAIASDPEPLRPEIRGKLLTGGGARFFEARLAGDGTFTSTVSEECPWDPPTKIVARHLGSYLAGAERDAAHARPEPERVS